MNYGVYDPTLAQQAQPAHAYPLARAPQYGLAGAEEPSTTDKIKTWLDTPTAGIKRSYLLGGAATLGLIYYGHTAGWFGKTKSARGR